MKWYQFTLRDLFLATTLIAVGFGGMAWWDKSGELLVAFGSEALIGAGIFAPFKLKVTGGLLCALLGAAAHLLVFNHLDGLGGI